MAGHVLAVFEYIDHLSELTTDGIGDIDQRAGIAKRSDQLMHEFFEVDRIAIESRDNNRIDQPGLSRGVEYAARVDFDARMRMDTDGGAVHTSHRANSLSNEVGIAGRVEQREVQAVVLAVSDFGFDRMMMTFFFGIESQILVPLSTLCSPDTAPVAISRASMRLVLPQEPCPAKGNVATLAYRY